MVTLPCNACRPNKPTAAKGGGDHGTSLSRQEGASAVQLPRAFAGRDDNRSNAELRPEVLNVVSSRDPPRNARQSAIRNIGEHRDMSQMPPHCAEVSVCALYFVVSAADIFEGDLRVGLARVTKAAKTMEDGSKLVTAQHCCLARSVQNLVTCVNIYNTNPYSISLGQFVGRGAMVCKERVDPRARQALRVERHPFVQASAQSGNRSEQMDLF
eukprot:2035685-Pleurochrysis_carterae.AAC.3